MGTTACRCSAFEGAMTQTTYATIRRRKHTKQEPTVVETVVQLTVLSGIPVLAPVSDLMSAREVDF